MAEEWNDIYDANRCLTGRVHLRGTPWKAGEYGLVVCVWVYDGRGHLLLTRRVSLLGALGYPVLLGTSRRHLGEFRRRGQGRGDQPSGHRPGAV